jgi:hypothetical protein
MKMEIRGYDLFGLYNSRNRIFRRFGAFVRFNFARHVDESLGLRGVVWFGFGAWHVSPRGVEPWITNIWRGNVQYRWRSQITILV